MIKNQKYLRQMTLPEIGEKGQEKLSKARVLVIGAGGLSCPALQYLTAAGIGHITVIDNDTVDNSNLHRQILFAPEDIGEKKAEVAALKLSILNSDVSITPVTDLFSPENALHLVSQHDLVLDGSDNFSTRYLVNDACVIKNKPFIFASLRRFEGQLTVFNYQNGPSYRCLFPTAPEDIPNCAEEGVLGITAGIIGMLQANEAIKLICDLGHVLSGKLLCYNTMTSNQFVLNVQRQAHNFEITELKDNYDIDCAFSHEEIDYQAYLHAPENYLLVDTREESDTNGLTELHTPDLESLLNIHSEKTLLLYCNTGLRSRRLFHLLTQKTDQKCAVLKGGLAAIDLEQIKP